MKHARDLSHEQLVRIVDDIQQILYLSANAQGLIWDPDREWDCETIEYIAGVLEDAGLKPQREMAPEPASGDNRLTVVIEQLIALDEANHEVQFAVDDLIYDEIGTGKHASHINNQGIANQADALVERLGLEDTIQALQAVLDDFAPPSEALVVEPPLDEARVQEFVEHQGNEPTEPVLAKLDAVILRRSRDENTVALVSAQCDAEMVEGTNGLFGALSRAVTRWVANHPGQGTLSLNVGDLTTLLDRPDLRVELAQEGVAELQVVCHVGEPSAWEYDDNLFDAAHLE